MGLKRLADMLDDLADCDAAVWPMQTGWTTPEEPAIVFAEIFPSIVDYEDLLPNTSTRDEAQVLGCIRHAAQLDARGELADYLEASHLTDTERSVAQNEEGWILFL